MKKTTSLGLSLLLVPAMTIGIGSAAFSQEQRPGQGAEQQQQRSADDAMHRSDTRAAEEQRTGPRSTEDVRASGQLEQSRDGDSMTQLSRKPQDAFNADDLIGTKLKSASSEENVGSISDLIIDQNGQVIAVVVGVGGFLGIGQKNVAISWGSLVPTRSQDGDGYNILVNETESSLRTAPEYKKD